MKYTTQILNALLHLFHLENIIYILLIIIGGFICIKVGDKILTKLEQKFDLNLTAHYLFKDIVKYTVIIVAIAWILHVLGINLESILISLGVVGIAIGFASQDIVSNFISGVFVISDKRIKVGEVIEVNNFKGTIKKVGFRNTIMINQDNFEITIPNSVLSKNIYKMYKPTEDHRLRIIATLPHGMNIPEFKEALDKIMYEYNWVISGKTTIFSKDYTEWGPKVEVSYWITEYKYTDCGKVTILENINRLIDEYKKQEK
ncbi:mechanosensitive ion channel domain-containing protein [Methanobrevibacter ruminantium]|uniref:mechanosensitive ion channel family protein n=1 Tax=Methanobrevibacter ruminantium TaxID=83816 RepID=UPI0026F0C47A|nr:mechanosensitive ion channel domain-containing protein [Methanobrevibacter ruminantium]MCI5737027.1 mechanosensitive ion channel family protein [Methanobrevibacter ruminantium]